MNLNRTRTSQERSRVGELHDIPTSRGTEPASIARFEDVVFQHELEDGFVSFVPWGLSSSFALLELGAKDKFVAEAM
jgi:hypothetical protein